MTPQSPCGLRGFILLVCNFEKKTWAHEQRWQVRLWRGCRWIHAVSPFISPSVSVRTSWLFYEQDVLCQLRALPLFCQASGSKQLNWTALAPHILRELSCFILRFFFFFPAVGFVNWLTNKATNPHYEQKQALTLLKWCVCVWVWVRELWWRTSKERREWQLVLLLVGPPDKIRVTGEHGTPQVPPSHTSTLLAAPIWSLTSPSPTSMSILFDCSAVVFLPPRSRTQRLFPLKSVYLQAWRYISILSLLSSYLYLSPPHYLSALHIWLLSLYKTP